MSVPCEEAPPALDVPSLRSRVLRGTMWMGGALWATRGLGMISTAILARLLAPQDFGLIAMATVITGFLNVLFTFGIDIALIQNAEAIREDWDSAWTVRLIQGLILAGLLVLLAPFAARFYGEPRVTMIMLVLAGCVVVGSFENIGVVTFRKELQFRRAFEYAVIRKAFAVCVTIPLALVLRDYTALLAGMVAYQVFSTAFSYVVHPFRPRWSLARARGIIGFTSRLVFINLAQYFIFEGERVIIGAMTGAQKTGLYSVSNEFAHMPTAELGGAFLQATFPGLVKIKHDPGRLRAAYLNVFGAIALYALPAGIGISLVAPDLVPLLLGPQWLDAVPLFQVMAITGALRAIYGPSYNLLTVLGRLNAALRIAWLQTGTQIIFLAPIIEWYGLIGAAALNLALAASTLLLYVSECAKGADASLRDHAAVVWRPVLGSAVMLVACSAVSPLLHDPIVSLVCISLLGAAVYTLVTGGLWLACGRPRGPEQYVISLLGGRLGFAALA